MTSFLINALSAFQSHPAITALMVFVLIAVAIAGFAGADISKALDGMWKLFASVLTAPLWFMRAVVRRLVTYRSDEINEASSNTFLLWKSTALAYVLVFLVASTIIAGGLVTSFLGAWPSSQLAQRKELKAALVSTDSAKRADSTSLATLRSSSAVDAEAQRQIRLKALALKDSALVATWQQLADSINLRPVSAAAFVSEVLTPYGESPPDRIPRDSTRLARLMVALDSFALRHPQDSLPPNELRDLRRWVSTGVERNRVVSELSLLREAVSTVAQQEALVSSMQTDSAQAASIELSLKEIDYWAGVKAAGWTLLLTYFALLIFVWSMGIAIESVGLVIGVSRDVAALRQQGSRNE